MGIFDALRRKQKPMKKRSYEGANVGRLFADFRTSQRSADSEIRYNLKTLRNRCRDLSRNNEYARKYIHLIKTNVVGERGVTLQERAINADGTLDTGANNIIEREFIRWGRLGNCTVDGKLSWVDAQAMVIESMARDGECLIRMVNYSGNPDKFALQFLEPDLIDEDKNERLADGRKIRMGVELDRYHRPIAYHLLSAHPGDIDFASPSRKTERVPADNILHLYMPDRAEQSRGVPWMSTAISSLKMLHGYREAELVAARTAASKMGFFTSPAGDGFTPDDYEDNVIPIMEAEPGTFQQLPVGVSFQQFDPQHPTSAFADFEKAILRGIASGLGVSYYALANDLTQTSYSSIRQGAIDDRDFYRTLQRFLIDHFVMPVFRRWLLQAMSVGIINLPISKYDKFADSASFRPRGFQWVDPQKEIAAQVTALQNGLISMQDVAGVYGRDVEETFAQIARDKQTASDFGLTMAFEPFGAQKLPVQPDVTGADDAGTE